MHGILTISALTPPGLLRVALGCAHWRSGGRIPVAGDGGTVAALVLETSRLLDLYRRHRPCTCDISAMERYYTVEVIDGGAE